MTHLKIENNPYARAFRDSITSETTNEPVKKGDDFPSPTKTVSPPQHQTLTPSNVQINKQSDSSVEESGN